MEFGTVRRKDAQREVDEDEIEELDDSVCDQDYEPNQEENLSDSEHESEVSGKSSEMVENKFQQIMARLTGKKSNPKFKVTLKDGTKISGAKSPRKHTVSKKTPHPAKPHTHPKMDRGSKKTLKEAVEACMLKSKPPK